MKISSKIFVGFALIILFSIVGFVINFRLSSEVNRNMEFLSKSESIVRNSVRLHKNMIDMQSAFRGFLLTENDDFLDVYYSGIKEVAPLYYEQRKLLADRNQAIKLDSIYNMHQAWVDYSFSLIQAKKRMQLDSSNNEEYLNLFEEKLKKQVGKKINDEISIKFREFDRFEYQVREQRRVQLNNSIQNTSNVWYILIAMIIIIGIAGAIYLTSTISKRILSMVHLANEISQGKFDLIKDQKNDELTDLSVSLNVMSLRLDKSFKDLERKNRELDQFAYVVSHDLKAPLRGMYNVFQWIQEDLGQELSEQMNKYLQMMKGRIERMESLITGLLEYARVDNNNNPLEEVSIAEMVTEVIEMVVPQTFNIKLVGKLPLIKTDKMRLQQVFTNLISNAVKYHGSQNGTITIGCKEHENFFKFWVNDDGVGIAPEYHEKIFKIFQTLREKNEKESTGVGLAIVKKIIEDKKGTIKVVSSPGHGSTFEFTWPKSIVNELVETTV